MAFTHTLNDFRLALTSWKYDLFEETNRCATAAMNCGKTDPNFPQWASRTDECCIIMRMLGISDDWETHTEVGKQWIEFINNN